MTFERVLANRSRIELGRGSVTAAAGYLQQALALTIELRGPRDIEVAQLLSDQSNMLTWDDELPAAERAARASLEIYDATVPKLHPDRLYAQAGLAEILRLQHKYDEATLLFVEVLDANRRIYGDANPRTADIFESLAKIAFDQRRLGEAERLARQAVEMQIRAAGSDHARVGAYRISLAMIQTAAHKYSESESQLRTALAVFAKTLDPDHPYVGAADHYLGEVMLATRRPQEAEAFYRAAIGITKRANEPKWRTARSASGLGQALYLQGRAREAEPYLVDSYRVLAADPRADEVPRIAARARVVRFYTEREQRDRLQALLVTARMDSHP